MLHLTISDVGLRTIDAPGYRQTNSNVVIYDPYEVFSGLFIPKVLMDDFYKKGGVFRTVVIETSDESKPTIDFARMSLARALAQEYGFKTSGGMNGIAYLKATEDQAEALLEDLARNPTKYDHLAIPK